MKRDEFGAEALLRRLAAWPSPGRYVVLASGGRDSTVLLHALAEIRERLNAPLVTLHFDHGIASDSAQWTLCVEADARSLGIPFFAQSLDVASGGALETRARSARYRRLGEWMNAGDCCLAAHHADDQAETFLLQALRGAGPAGLAAMPALSRYGAGWLGRPLLEWTRAELAAWAHSRELSWVEDPGNADSTSPRNRLRRDLWPVFLDHWPSAARTLSRSAALAAESTRLLETLARLDIAPLGGCDVDRLPVNVLAALDPERRRNLLHHWLRWRQLPVPSAAKLRELDNELIRRDPGPRASLAWAGMAARRYRGMLHVGTPLPAMSSDPIALKLGEWLGLGALGQIAVMADPGGLLDSRILDKSLTIRFRRGGERIRPAGTSHHRAVKKLLQESGVFPWVRGHLPFLYADEELAAVAEVAVAAECAGSGLSLVWRDSPPLR